jgi:ribonuclease Z
MAFEVTILGNSSASPTINRHPSSQYINICEHHLLVDCGEGTQMQLQRYKIKKSKISHIFISHVHGDHILGLPGLLLSMNLMKHEQAVNVYGPKELFEILAIFFKHSETDFSFPLNYHVVDPSEKSVVMENLYFSVKSFPLYHRIPTIGYFFEERATLKKLNLEACQKHKIPFTYFNNIKMGKDYNLPDGNRIRNEELTFPSTRPISYAYCSDTIYDERVIKAIYEAYYLYHEATFMHDKLERAIKTMHTTAKQAGMVATQAKVNELLIGHFSSRYEDLTPLLEEAKSEFKNTRLAIEGTTFVLE